MPLKKPVKNSKKTTRTKLIKTWREAAKLKLYRQSPLPFDHKPELIDSGVNFFVLKLEELGALTCFSCEGHPNGFYIMFKAPQTLALDIYSCGFFTVELAGKNYWRLSIHRPEVDEHTRRKILNWAAQSWAKRFGPIVMSKEQHASKRKKQKIA